MDNDARLSLPIDDDALISARRLSYVLGVHPQTAQRWLHDGRIPSVHLGGRAGYRIRAGDVRVFLAQRLTRPADVAPAGE